MEWESNKANLLGMVSPASSTSQYIWNKVTFGTTLSRLGTYQIIMTIQYLAHWSNTVYRPWFLRNALGICESDEAGD